jgi:GT2 family glycosyltransferase
VNYNGSTYIANCLGSVLKSSYDPFEIILVDNASTDDSISIVKELFNDDRIIIVRNSSNLGFAEGNNIGAEYARGGYLVFLNNDTKVEPTWVEELVKVMESDPKIGAAQSKLLMLNHDGRIIDSTGDFLDFYGVAMQRGLGEEDLGQHENVEEVFSARGACMIVRRSVIREVGLFDPDFFMTLEDIDLCWRIRLKGYKVVYVPRSVVYHKGFGTPSNLRAYHGEKNVFLLMIKNYNSFNLMLHLFPHLIITLGILMFDIFVRRNMVLVYEKINVLKWNLLNLQRIITKRRIVQSLIRTIPDTELKKTMLQSNLALYTRYMLEVHRALKDPVRLKKVINWYFFMTNPL